MYTKSSIVFLTYVVINHKESVVKKREEERFEKKPVYSEAFIECSKWLKLTEQEMFSRHKMGIESAKRLVVPTK